MENSPVRLEIDAYLQKAVSHYWQTRAVQKTKQEKGGKTDQGLRSAVTGGAQMDGFIDLFSSFT